MIGIEMYKMMHRATHSLNRFFLMDPIGFVNGNAINQIGWYQKYASNFAEMKIIKSFDDNKYGFFQFTKAPKMNEAEFTPVGGGCAGDLTLSAYWCPYLTGIGLPGYVDFSAVNPERNFIFTAAMSGCSLEVTRTPNRPGMLRVYHNQHPTSKIVRDKVLAQGEPILKSITFDDYGRSTVGNSFPNGFVFLHYSNDGWQLVAKSQYYELSGKEVAVFSGKPAKIVPVTKWWFRDGLRA